MSEYDVGEMNGMGVEVSLPRSRSVLAASTHARRVREQVLPERIGRSPLYQALVRALAGVWISQNVSPFPGVGSGVGSKPRGGLVVVGIRRFSVRVGSQWQGEGDGDGEQEGVVVGELL